MTDDQNPFLHPAEARFQELLREAEELAQEQTAAQPSHDPFQPYHLALDWGIDPWVQRMYEVDRQVTILQAEALNLSPSDGTIKQAFKEIAVGALQALILFEEVDSGEQGLDDTQLASFLEALKTSLDDRIGKLRIRDKDDEDPWSTPAVERRTQEFLNEPQGIEEPPPGLVVNENGDLVDPDVQPGLAFVGPHGDIVAGEGNDGTPLAGVDTGEWAPSFDDTPSPKRRPPMSEVPFYGGDIGPATHVEPETPPKVDLNGAERALAREITALRQEAAGSTAIKVVGRHASSDPTDPGAVKEGKH